ncbi:uncharacterized protein BYT42DRAFT_565355 [Radiomyces spectabilis]|uniref:uncharacterized protein n=1 Tax=Radiomyces spectabilis TaxID=64574 RepID=UPI00221FDF51|nr:uncharacterized protein BYT42DRAFT_565355 [Radiomyces spectabilis]KAI8381127.1 hypothetical protein BYT42DRAFT_565355 [Radiomyces spectabilis]
MNQHNVMAGCLRSMPSDTPLFEPQAEDILTDEDLLDLFRIVKQFLRKKPDAERLAKLLFCVSYGLGDSVKSFRPLHEDKLYFRDDNTGSYGIVRLPGNTPCCKSEDTAKHRWSESPSSPLSRFLSVSYLTNSQQTQPPTVNTPAAEGDLTVPGDTSTDAFSVRPYTNFRPLYPSQRIDTTEPTNTRYPPLNTLMNNNKKTATEVLMEPKQRGFYYQDGRIGREPALLQRYAEQGVLTQASLMRKRRRQFSDIEFPYELSTLPAPAKKPKIPHRNGEFEKRRDNIISRMRSITTADLEQKAQRIEPEFTLAIEHATVPTIDGVLSAEEAAELLEPALRILMFHSNMKPHLDNGMNQNGIYYNTDYFRLYLAFEQFQRIFAVLFPHEVVKIPEHPVDSDKDRDRERNINMKSYRRWIEPLLAETNWPAFRRNLMVGERMMQLTKIVGQGVLLMTKELSGSKLHLTFTNQEWDEFITGLSTGKWDETVQWEATPGNLVVELRRKFATQFWFHPNGVIKSSAERKEAMRATENDEG